MAKPVQVPPAVKETIRWTEEEWTFMTERVWILRKQTPQVPLVSLINQAQATLPTDRQRVIRTIYNAPQFPDLLTARDEALLKLENRLKAAEAKLQQMPPPITEEMVVATMPDDKVLANFKEKVLSLLSPDEVLSRYPTDMLIETIPFAQLASHVLTEGMTRLMERPKPEIHVHMSAPAAVGTLPTVNGRKTTPTVRLPKFVICPLLGDQQQIVGDKLKGRANLVFVETKQSNVQQDADYFIAMTRFMGHQHEKNLRNQCPPDKFVRISGGLSRLVQKIESLLPTAAT